MTSDHGIRPEPSVAASPHSSVGPSAHWTLRRVAETGSTNADLLDLLDGTDRHGLGPARDGLVLRTDHQTAGRGRLDRRWDAPPGSNLLVSLLFTVPPERPHAITQAVGVAAVRVADRILASGRSSSDPPAVPSVKWPNDVLLGGAKLAGVLAQRHAAGPVVVGIGLNVGWAPSGAARLVTSDTDRLDPEFVLRLLLTELDVLAPAGRVDEAAVIAVVRERMSTLGSDVRVELPAGDVVEGRAVGLGDDGRLHVETSVGRRSFDVGDVHHLRPA